MKWTQNTSIAFSNACIQFIKYFISETIITFIREKNPIIRDLTILVLFQYQEIMMASVIRDGFICR